MLSLIHRKNCIISTDQVSVCILDRHVIMRTNLDTSSSRFPLSYNGSSSLHSMCAPSKASSFNSLSQLQKELILHSQLLYIYTGIQHKQNCLCCFKCSSPSSLSHFFSFSSLLFVQFKAKQTQILPTISLVPSLIQTHKKLVHFK